MSKIYPKGEIVVGLESSGRRGLRSVQIGFIVGISILVASNFPVHLPNHRLNLIEKKDNGIDDHHVLWHRPFQQPKVKNMGKTAVVCAIAKHELPYIWEWLDYNIALGFTHIYLYDNSDLFEMRDLNEKYRKYGIVDVIHFPGLSRQCESYYDCANRSMSHNHTWAFFQDVDEFLVLKQHNNVIDFASEYAISGLLGINWRVFGMAGKEVYEPIPVLKRFQYRSNTNYSLNSRVKSIVRLKHMQLSSPCKSPHVFPLKHGFSQVLTDGTVFKGSWYEAENSPDDIAAIYHYQFKSYQEYISKKMRGDVYFGNNISISQTINDAINRLDKFNNSIIFGDIYDDTAWVNLKKMIPRYELYDQLYPLQ